MTNNTNKKPIIWTISGADCSGGAGIAADIKTGHALNVEVCHLITANTVQNSQQLLAINATSINTLQQQVDCLLADKAPSIIKVGLLACVEQITWLVGAIKQIKFVYPQVQVIFDPVGQASVGGKFSSILVQDLLPLLAITDVLTPNLLEAQQLTASTSDNAEELAEKIIALGVKQIIIKGGHHVDKHQCVDYCYSSITQLAYQLNSPRIDTDYSHGGGCSFASALASFLAHGYLLRDAFTLAKAFIVQGLKTSEGKKDYYGAFEQQQWPNSAIDFPAVEAQVNQKYAQLAEFQRLDIIREGKQALGLYPVVDSVEWLKQLMPLGINIIQLRLKNKTEQELRAEIKEAVELSKQFDCRLFINDFWQLAIEYGAYGVHIGQEDLLDASLATIQESGLRLGISTHGCYEFLLAQQLRPSYLAIGAIFPTKTKDMTGQIQGVENLRQTLQLATDIPVVAIGGINHQRAEQVWQTGVDSIAVVTAITESKNAETAVKQFQQILK
jgi:hydroxymethylpyrimidine kinase/phosphomethylpyrimidine kinase/thiamine-phosphate diphosphorylase